jgi:hypothetical protein
MNAKQQQMPQLQPHLERHMPQLAARPPPPPQKTL